MKTRRGFLGILASLPTVRMLFGKVGTAPEIGSPRDLEINYRRDAAWQDGRTRVIRWIPVTERLPTNKVGNVLVCYNDGRNIWKCPTIDLMPTLPDGEFNSYYMHSLRVTHWAELPTPPQR